jgi:meso-butanediol dehydrogenase / (S,S)-butanediol dehydrogenase / diacetyl reductase
MDEGRGLERDEADEREMMTAGDVAEVVLFVLERPRHLRVLETAFRGLNERSWG